MVTDCFGLELPSANPLAVAAFDRAQLAFLKYRDGTMGVLDQARRAQPDFVAAHAFSGFLRILQARANMLQLAKQDLSEAQQALERLPSTQVERSLVAGLASASAGDWAAAAGLLEGALDPGRPHPLLVKIVHTLRFMIGDAAGMLALTGQFSGQNLDHVAGYGFVLGCHAFALEENGSFEEAETVAQKALFLEPEDFWGMHALAHVYEATRRTGEGLLWVESGRQQWSGCNNFASHLAWHLALFCIDRGKYDRAVNVFDTDLRPNLTDDFRDFANAVSLLVRLRQMGVDTGSRLDGLYDEAKQRVADVTYVFAALHGLPPLLARGDVAAVRDVIVAMQELASGNGNQAQVAREVGVPFAEAMLEIANGPAKVAGLQELAQHLPLLGGSVTQRDMFLRAMILMADDVCDHKTTSALIGIRHRLRHEDAFSELIEHRICFGGSSADTTYVA